MSGRRAAIRAAWTRRPTVTVAVLGIVPVVVTAIWADRNRGFGSLNIDESGLTGQAYRLHHDLLRGDLSGFVEHLLSSEPLAPLLVAPAFLLGGAGVNTPVVVLAVVGVACAVATTAMVRRLAGPGVAIVAGIVALAFPQALHAARTYGFGLAASIGLVAAGCALVHSDRGRRLGAMVAFGAATGAMVSARAMTVAFVPALVAAAWVQIGDDRRGRRHAAVAAAIALVVAAPYWTRKWGAMWNYLTAYGYGDRSSNLERNAPLWLGPPYRALEWLASFGVVTTVAALGLVASVVVPRRRELLGWLRGPWDPWTRDVLTVGVIAAGGYGALFTTVNSGLNFTLPLSYFLIVLVAAVSTRASRPARRRAGTAFVASAAAALVLTLVGRMPEGGPGSLPWVLVDVQGNENRAASGDPELDRRWWAANERLADLLGRYAADGRRIELLVVGDGSEEMNGGTVALVTAVRDEDPSRVSGLRGTETPAEMDVRLRPVPGHDTVVVVIAPVDGLLGPADAPAAFMRHARRHGWRTTGVVELPDGGTTTVMTHPRWDSDAPDEGQRGRDG